MSDWRDSARCTDDPERWFPIGKSSAARKQARDAKAICRTCPVLAECGAWALETRPKLSGDMIAGGLDGEQRARIWRAQERQAARARKAAGA